jgi:hypothetical protein
VAFKDIGADQPMVRDLTDAIHSDGRSALLEIADMTDRGQAEGMQLALSLGVDMVIGAWRPDFADGLRATGFPEYWPFLGTLRGNPLSLTGGPSDLATMAARVSQTGGVRGVVLMPYRQQNFDPVDLMESVSRAATVPLLVAGGVSGVGQIEAVAQCGAWGFTMGGAVLSDRLQDPGSVNLRVGRVLELCRQVSTRHGTVPGRTFT